MENEFARYLANFFTEYLSAERGVSRHTLRSYAAAFSELLDFMKSAKNIQAEKINLTDINRENINEYLNWIESTRGCSVSTRNQRLAALRSFCRYMQYVDVVRLAQWQAVMNIKVKKHAKVSMNYLSIDGVKAILDQIPTNTIRGRRDLALLSLLYETGARVQELVDLRPVDVCLLSPSCVTLFGKGRKKRIVPIQKAQASILKQYMEENGLLETRMNQRPLFQNGRGGRLTGAGVTYILKNYASMARDTTLDLIPEVISPHCLRHSKAMHLLQAGVNLVYIRDILGHVSIRTTEIYARADSKQKREALELSYAQLLPADNTMATWEKNPELKNWLKSLGK